MPVRYKTEDSTNISQNAHQEDQEDDDAVDIYNFSENKEVPSREVFIIPSDIKMLEDKPSLSSRSRRISSLRPNRITYENTYWTEPKPGKYFIWFKARNMINSLVEPLLETFTYESKAAGQFCKLICNKVVLLIKKNLDCPRYKYICHVTLAEFANQGLIIADRSLWLPQTDNCASLTFVKKDLVMVVTFHGVYLE